MTTVRLFLAGDRVGPKLDAFAKKTKRRVLDASRGAALDVTEEIVSESRADIANAGKFGGRWTGGFKGKVTEGGGYVRVAFTMAVPYWKVFEYGATIRGRPLLWIPLSFAKDAQGISARDYPGKLFRVNRKSGAPLLLASGNPAQPKYFGKASVRIPKKFHLVQIIRSGAKKMREFYSQRMKENSDG